MKGKRNKGKRVKRLKGNSVGVFSRDCSQQYVKKKVFGCTLPDVGMELNCLYTAYHMHCGARNCLCKFLLTLEM